MEVGQPVPPLSLLMLTHFFCFLSGRPGFFGLLQEVNQTPKICVVRAIKQCPIASLRPSDSSYHDVLVLNCHSTISEYIHFHQKSLIWLHFMENDYKQAFEGSFSPKNIYCDLFSYGNMVYQNNQSFIFTLFKQIYF